MNRECKDFLHDIFGPDLTGVYVCDSTNWQPQEATGAVLDAKAGWYWCPSRLSGLDPAGQRVADRAVSVHALVLDDIGTKVPMDEFEMFAGSPKRMIETSQGNYQAVYYPLDVTPEAFAELRGRVPWGLDGASCVHWWRLPGGVNPKNGFATRQVPPGTGAGDLDWLPAARGGARGTRKAGGPGQKGTLGEVQALLDALDNSVAGRFSYDDWIAVGIAVWGAVGEEGREAWIDWSRKSPICGVGFQPEDKWETFPDAPVAGIGALEIMVRGKGDWQRVAGAVFDDGAAPPAGPTVLATIADIGGGRYLYHGPTGEIIEAATGAFWKPTAFDKMARAPLPKTSASSWLARNHWVTQVSWIPGSPKLIRGQAMVEIFGGLVADDQSIIWNLYDAPVVSGGDAGKAGPWVAHVQGIWPGEADWIFDWLAHRVQKPGEKINHALVLGGEPGIGKDMALQPVVSAVGPSNWQERGPTDVFSQFNDYLQAVVLRISEIRDLGGETTQFDFYERTKTMLVSPPETLSINRKHRQPVAIPNVVGAIMTSNHMDGIYLPDNDRRHFVAWSALPQGGGWGDVDYFMKLGAWLAGGGTAHVAAWLRARDISKFNAFAPPRRTKAWQAIVDANVTVEDDGLGDALDALGRPAVVTVEDAAAAAEKLGNYETANWLRSRFKKQHQKKFNREGYEVVRNPARDDGRWQIAGSKVTIYGKKGGSPTLQKQAAEARVKASSSTP